MAGRATNELGNYFALGRQTAKDTEATTFFFLKHLDGTGWEIAQDVTAEREGGDGQEVGLRYKTMIKADGAAVVNARPQVAARFLTYTLGADASVASTAAGTFADHTILPTTSIPYITAEQKFGDLIERSTNNLFTGLVIEGEAGRPIKLTANMVNGGSVYARSAAASALTATRETTKPIFFPGGSYTLDAQASQFTITKFKIEAQRGVDDNIQTTGLNREDVVALNQDYNLDMTLKYEDKTIYEKVQFGAAGGTQISVPFLATGSFNAFSLGEVGSYSMRLNMPLVEYIDVKVNKLDPDGKTVYLDVVAQSVRNATFPLFAVVRTGDQTAY
jgi:hypothetical protein